MELQITSEPFEGAIRQMLTLINEKGRGPETEEVLETIKRRFCIDAREQQIAQEAYETGELRMFYYQIESSPSTPARAR